MKKEAVLEGLLFVVGDEGLTLEQITQILEVKEEEAKEFLANLRKEYQSENRGIRIHFLGNTFKLTTKEEHREYYQKLIENPYSNTISNAALETLAIIAYNEPITRIAVDEIRGVGSGQMIRNLVAKGFVKECGKADLPGKPLLYKTTNDFLDYFGLASMEDLPKLEALEEIDHEVDLFHSKYSEDNKDE